jgi:hypothetical protein
MLQWSRLAAGLNLSQTVLNTADRHHDWGRSVAEPRRHSKASLDGSVKLMPTAAHVGRSRGDRNGPYGVSEKFRFVEDEHDVAIGQLFIASAFVLGQAAITQAISIATRVREIAGEPSTLPQRKPAIMATEAPLHQESGLSEIAIVDAVADHFKHCRVGGGAPLRWPPSAAQTARTGFPYAAFTKTQDFRDAKDGIKLIQPGSQARTRRRAPAQAAASSRRCASV